MTPARLHTSPDVVLLDLGDTLVRPDPSWRGVYASVFASWGVEAESADFYRAFSEAWAEWESEGPFEATEEASFRRLMDLDQRVFARLGYPDLPERFYRDVEAAFHRRAAWFVYPDVVPALDVLRASGKRLAVVSNWGWSAPELLHLLELASHFEAFSISARVGYQKPHPAIFEHALELLGARPERAIHVGDNPAADVVGARRAGIVPVLMDRSGREAKRAPEGTLVVCDMLELLDAMGLPRPLLETVAH